MADALMEYETLSADQIDDIMAGAKPRAPGDGGPANRAKGERPSSSPGAHNIGGPAEEH
jgi:cell division protease FtsH